MPNTLEEKDWNILLQRIKNGKCTPFLGAGACFGTLPLGANIAQEWAEKYGYPLKDRDSLIRVAQYMAVTQDVMIPKEEIIEQFKKVKLPDGFFKAPDEPHGVLADLPLPVYMTTNYDDFMMKALESRYKDPKREMCRWNKLIKDQPSIFGSQPGFKPTPANPVVFHFHGHNEVPESLVLTEDDYLEFLAEITRDPDLLPSRIQEAMKASSFLFIGYSLADWNFRVLFQGLKQRLQGLLSVAVMLPPPGDSEETRQKEKAQNYMKHYYEAMDLRVYWGTAREFAAELRKRWEGFSK
jgi:SIR2-like protein